MREFWSDFWFGFTNPGLVFRQELHRLKATRPRGLRLATLLPAVLLAAISGDALSLLG